MSGLYVYAVVGSGFSGPLGDGLAGEPLRLAGEGAARAVVGEMPAPPGAEAASLAAHDAVVRRLTAVAPALLPARFGQWLPDEAAVVEWLAAHGRELAAALARVAGCEQMTLRVYRVGEAESPAAMEPEPSGLGPGALYLERRRRAAERERSLPEIAPLREALRPLVRDERIVRSESRLRATVYDLIERGAAEAYSRLVAEAAARLPEWRITASGPWPPYAFAPRPLG